MKIFDALDQLSVGDYFIISVLGEDHAYRVTSTEVVLPDETESLAIVPGKDLVTLVTCTPYGLNTHRLLVHAERCEVPEEWLNKEPDAPYPDGYSDPVDPAFLPSVLIGLALSFAVIGGYLAWFAWRRRGGRKIGGHVASGQRAGAVQRCMPTSGPNVGQRGLGKPTLQSSRHGASRRTTLRASGQDYSRASVSARPSTGGRPLQFVSQVRANEIREENDLASDVQAGIRPVLPVMRAKAPSPRQVRSGQSSFHEPRGSIPQEPRTFHRTGEGGKSGKRLCRTSTPWLHLLHRGGRRFRGGNR